MALAGRSARRGGAGIRWITIGVAITVLILLINASLKSRSPAPGQQLAAGTWIDRVLPIVSASTEQGDELAGIWTNGLKMPGPAISRQMDAVATGASSEYQQVIKLKPPVNLEGPAGLLEASLLARSEAAQQLKSAFGQVLGAGAQSGPAGPGGSGVASAVHSATNPGGTSSTTSSTIPQRGVPPATELQSIARAGSDIQVGDQAYQLFTSSLPASLGIRLPSSVWAINPGAYQPQTAEVFLTSLQNAVVTSPVHQVKIYALTTTPAPVSTQGPTEVIPDASAMTVTVVVADTGNQPETNLTVTAALSAAQPAASSSVRDFLNLRPGQAYTIVDMGPLNPLQGVPVTLTVTVTPQNGSPAPLATAAVAFQMPAPPPPSTTTTPTTASGATGGGRSGG